MANMAWRHLRLAPIEHLAVISQSGPTDDEWARYLRDVKELPVEGLRGAWGLILSEGGGPNGPQRKALAEVKTISRIPTAVVTGSMLARGLVMATSWLGKEIRAFAPQHLTRAFDYLAVAPTERPRVVEELAVLRAELLGLSLSEVKEALDVADHQQYVVEESLATIRERMSSVRDRLGRLKR